MNIGTTLRQFTSLPVKSSRSVVIELNQSHYNSFIASESSRFLILSESDACKHTREMTFANRDKSTLMIVEHTSEMTFAARDKSTLMIVEHTRYMTFPTRDKSMPLDMLPDSIKWIVCFRIHSNSSNMLESSRCLILSESDASDKM